MIRVIIVEDHTYTADGLKSALNSLDDISVIGTAGNATDGLKLALSLQPDIVMLDLHLPDSPPVRELLHLFCNEVEWKVIVFSSESRRAFVDLALESGAAAFLSKSELIEKVQDTLQLVHDRKKRVISKELCRQGTPISPALKDILQLMGKGKKYTEIAELRGVNPETVRRQCELLQIKLGLASREHLISWAVLNGYASLD
jgi:two-component system nitrate/nitrite response regulator NarL